VIPAAELAGKIGVPTYMEEIEVGTEVAIPGLDYLVTIRDTDTAARRTDDSSVVHVVVLTYERIDGAPCAYEAPKLARLRRYVPLDETKLSASYGTLTKDETAELVPALVDEVESLRTKLEESRRIRASLTPGGVR